MKKITLAILLALGLGSSLPVDAKKEHLLPLPQKMTATEGKLTFAAGSTVTVAGIDSSPALVKFLNEFGVKKVNFDASAASGDIHVSMVSEIKGAYDHQLPDYDNEAYTLKVSANGVEITAVSKVGVIRAAQTLTQLAEGYEEPGVNLEYVDVTDWPAFKLRGFMHDVGRSYIDFKELKKQVELLSRFKINTFHWHLTENLAWRFEVKAFPALTEAKNMVRQPGKFYTQDECRELVQFAEDHGVTIIPEIDIPGHSAAFTKALGYDMQTDKGKEALKTIFKEVVDVFKYSPYIHIGGDEVATTEGYLNEMIDYVKSQYGKKIVVWNPIRNVNVGNLHADMCQLWSTAGKVVKGKTNIDCRYNYVNHFDVYADLVGIYKSNIYYTDKGNADVAGTISATWNDTKTPNDEQLVKQNNIYANALASAERAWLGGGKQYVEKGGTTLPNSGEEFEAFKSWENRFLFHKAHSLKNEPIAYVKQTNVRWRITDPFPNGGNNALLLPPETDKSNILPDVFTYQGETYNTRIATGAGIYLRHIWHPTVPSFFNSPADNQTAYAWTYVYSPKAQKVGAQIEFYTYSRSGWEKGPDAGNWDRRGSKVWVNGKEIAAPGWKQPGKDIPQDHATEGLMDENFTGRPVVQMDLVAGWNKVFMRLPHVNAGGTKRDKWQFTFVFTDLEGKNAVEGLIYSPNQCKDEAAEKVAAKVAEIKNYRNAQVKEQPGYFDVAVAAALDAEIAKVENTYGEDYTEAQRDEQMQQLETALAAFKNALAGAKLVMPKLSEGSQVFYYTMSTPLRENRFATSKGAGADMVGETSAGKTAYWKFVTRSDKDWDIVNFDGSFVSPESQNNTALKTQASSPSKGWKLGKADATGYLIITSGSAQFNQTNNSQLGYKVYNWGSGNNTTDAGCKYAIKAVNMDDLQVDPALPQDGQNYYFYNFHKKGNQYFYDNGGEVGFGAQKMEKRKSYVWTCKELANGHYYFKNLATGKYFAWKALSGAACEWALNTAKTGDARVSNDGCVSMQAVNQSGSNYMVCVMGGFDQARNAGFFNDKFSSDFKFELCTNNQWEDEEIVENTYYSKNFGENWVRLFWNNNNNDAAGVADPSATSFNNASAKSQPVDMTSRDQLWSLVGDDKGFYLQNAVVGKDLALHVGATSSGTEAKFVNVKSATKWVLVDKGGVFAIAPTGNKGQSLNSFGGPRMILKLYDSNDGGSKWKLQSGIVEAMKITTMLEGENPYGENAISLAGNLRFSINGAAVVSSVYTNTMGERTYYLPNKSKIELTQQNGPRGFVSSGLYYKGKETSKVTFTVGEEVGEVKAMFKGSNENGLVLYFTPGKNGKPYRIPAIATAKNGDIVAISDFRPGGQDVGRGEVDVKYRISTDNGKTWGEEKTLADGNWGKGAHWQYSFGDAAVVADRESNKILVMMVCGNKNCWDGNYDPNDSSKEPNRVARCYGTYDEANKTWNFTDPVEVTNTIYPKFVKNNQATVQSLFIGSGRICQSRVTKVGDYYRLYCAVWTKNDGNRVIYSDDFGESWNVLGTVDDRPGRGGDEPKCEEMPDGSVILSSRRDGRLFNIFKYSNVKEGKGSWQTEEWSETRPGGIVVHNTTNGEMMLVKAIRLSDNQKVDLALQSVPFGNGRNNVGLYFKEITKDVYHSAYNLASNWTKGLQVSHVGSAYSTMTIQHDHKIGFFFEEEPGNYCMVYIPLTIEQITNNKFKLDEESYQTGIEGLVVESNKVRAAYDLSGRRVANPQKGLYIVDGQKVILK